MRVGLSEQQARALLPDQYQAALKWEELTGGQVSQAFGFRVGDEQLVLRVNRFSPYDMDVHAAGRFAGTAVPVPEVLATGHAEGLHWALSRRAAGVRCDTLDLEAQRELVPDLVRVLTALHSADVGDTEGYGVCVAPGKGACGSLREALLHGGGHVDWTLVSQRATKEEQELLDAAMRTIKPLLDLCPDTRMQFHGDFGLGNTLGADGVVTALVDWTYQGYGDPLWDVACLDLWRPQVGFAEAYMEAQRDAPWLIRAEERLHLHRLLLARGALGLFIQAGQPDKARFTFGKLESMI